MSNLQQGFASGDWLTRERIGAYSLILIAAYAAFLAWLGFSATGHIDAAGRPLGTDFANVWSTGRLVLAGRAAEAFDPEVLRPFQQAVVGHDAKYFFSWHYPPMFLAVAGALAMLPYLPALVTWVVLSTALYVLTIRAILGPAVPTRLAVLAALAYPAVFANATHGHNGTLSALLFGAGLLALRDNPGRAGIAFGLLAFKPQYGLFLPLVLALGAYWRAIGAAALTVTVTALGSLALFGSDVWTAFVAQSGYAKLVLEEGAAGWSKLQGVFPAVRMYGGSIGAAYAMQTVFTVLVGVALVWLWRSRAAFEQKAAGLVLAAMIALPYSYNYDSTLLAVAIAFLVRHGVAQGFARYEASVLALLWIAPLVSRDLTDAIPFPYATVIQSTTFALLMARVAAETAEINSPVGQRFHASS